MLGGDERQQFNRLVAARKREQDIKVRATVEISVFDFRCFALSCKCLRRRYEHSASLSRHQERALLERKAAYAAKVMARVRILLRSYICHTTFAGEGNDAAAASELRHAAPDTRHVRQTLEPVYVYRRQQPLVTVSLHLLKRCRRPQVLRNWLDHPSRRAHVRRSIRLLAFGSGFNGNCCSNGSSNGNGSISSSSIIRVLRTALISRHMIADTRGNKGRLDAVERRLNPGECAQAEHAALDVHEGNAYLTRLDKAAGCHLAGRKPQRKRALAKSGDEACKSVGQCRRLRVRRLG